MTPILTATPGNIGEAASAPNAMENVVIGTQGWSFESWAGVFYPKGLPAAERLAWYSRTFNGVEVNTSFHAVPSVAAVRNWRSATPADFTFTLKMPRAITHEGRLRDPEPDLSSFLNAATELGSKLGAVLVQLPPSFGATDLPALDRFLQRLPVHELRFCVEVRRPELRSPGVRELLRRRGTGLVSTNLTSAPGEIDVVNDLVYLRLLGPRHVPDQLPNVPADEPDFGAFRRQAGSWAAALRLALASPSSSRVTAFGFAANDFFGPGFLPATYLMKQLGHRVFLPAGSFLEAPVQGTLL
jgi:uncharacterized protein YecE (DUF72 family)